VKYREYINKLKERPERELAKNEYEELRKDERFWISLSFTATTVMLAITKILGSTWSILFAIIYLAFYVLEIHRVETNIKSYVRF